MKIQEGRTHKGEDKDRLKDIMALGHTSNLSRVPRLYPCKFFLAGVNFYRFNAENWHFRQILCKKWHFFLKI